MKDKRISLGSRWALALSVVLGAALLLLAVAGLQVQIAAADCDNAPSTINVTGCTNVLIPDTGAEASDYYQRHPGSTIAIVAVASDWFERHPEMLNVATAADLSDYFQRHPTALKLGNDAVATDYFQRHRDSFKLGNAVELTDWFQRHPELMTR